MRTGPSYSPNGHSVSKRPRLDDDYGRFNGPADYMGGGGPGMVSRVLQARNLKDQVMEADLVDALSQFGPVSYVSITGRGVSLVEFEDSAAAERCVNYNMGSDILVLGQPAIFNFSSLQTIPRQGWESDRPNNVVVMYVQNPKYPITADVISAICKPICRVLRIMIMREGGQIQCLVEFADIDAARNIKQRLNGCDIYSGCCTLKIEYAKLTRLNVTRNDQDQADYVTPPAALSAGNFNTGIKDRPALLQEPPVFTGSMLDTPRQGHEPGLFPGKSHTLAEPGFDDFSRNMYDDRQRPMERYPPGPGMGGPVPGPRGPPPYDDELEYMGGGPPVHGGGPPGMYGGGLDRYPPGPSGPPRMPPPPSFDGRPPGAPPPRSKGPDGCGLGVDNAVVMLYGLNPDKINCDRLFNLLCQYGNVMRIKFLKSKQDTCMVQMGDPIAVQRLMDNLRNCVLFGNKLSMNLSRQAQVSEVREPTEMPDKTSSYKDFSNSRNNRFLTPDIASKNRINPPQKYLYFFNAPPRVTEDELMDAFVKNGAPKPDNVKIFEKKGDYAKNSAGIVEFANEEEAVEAIACCNHMPVDYEGGKHPFLVKLCFAGPPSSSLNSDSGPPRSRGGPPSTYNGPVSRDGGDGRGPPPRGPPPRGGGGGRGGFYEDDDHHRPSDRGPLRGRGGGNYRGGGGDYRGGGGDYRGGSGRNDYRGGRGDFRGGRGGDRGGRGGPFRGGRGRGNFRGRGGER